MLQSMGLQSQTWLREWAAISFHLVSPFSQFWYFYSFNFVRFIRVTTIASAFWSHNYLMFSSVAVSKWILCSPPDPFLWLQNNRAFYFNSSCSEWDFTIKKFLKMAHRCYIFWVLSCLKMWALAFILKLHLGWVESTWIIFFFLVDIPLCWHQLLLKRHPRPDLFMSL